MSPEAVIPPGMFEDCRNPVQNPHSFSAQLHPSLFHVYVVSASRRFVSVGLASRRALPEPAPTRRKTDPFLAVSGIWAELAAVPMVKVRGGRRPPGPGAAVEMKTVAILIVGLTVAFSAMGAERAPVRPFESTSDLTPEGKIDELVFDRLKGLGIQPAYLCSDGVFLRRVHLDVIGTLPTAQEAWQFLNDPDPDKRGALVDRLLDRQEFADYWTMKPTFRTSGRDFL